MIKTAKFLVSNTDPNKCPAPTKPEFAFIGRSNVGKSSLINMLTNHKGLAKTSGRPGKTQLINHFVIDEKWFMVDLPGYGFAKVSKTLKGEWDKMIKGYLTQRENLEAIFVLIDSRLEPQKIDLEFILWCAENEVPIVLIFTKADKLSHSKVQGNVSNFLKAAKGIFEETPLYFVTSAESAKGREEVLEFIDAVTEDFYAEN
ncbi:ribosome biogenesis GTP-binding protein YihA/YsxC [Litoribacter ruber]|uniref:Probable GTP-binding protein EngB n=1 Tax=Litoribacter ruber TaxID=702568 RepID=A0AAP2CPJ9_9BACT|nr:MULTISPECIES: ribosome biogenesis GTP-binding protein YihA/YsxC [Litoribacter]MBS9525552.1 ribosome biogenesis GTP-binding protein YihA/YsxC [Litoribacter alkaliphilus]MBT0812801.1 ribosome biogenesis GTP-binding protein YihA/YsxC [Litoribacter ruber]